MTRTLALALAVGLLASACGSSSMIDPPAADAGIARADASAADAETSSMDAASGDALEGDTGSTMIASPEMIDLPGGSTGISFDDLRFSPSLGKVLAPGSSTGRVDVIDPNSHAVTPIESFGGAASVDGAFGLVFAVDRSAQKLVVADLASSTVLARVDTSSFPDYVRVSPIAREVWVTEPGRGQIEVFSIPDNGTPTPQSIATIAISGDVEGLVFDTPRRRAYTHQVTSVAAIDADTHAYIESYPLSCTGTHGIPVIDEARGLLFAGCRSTRVVVLNLLDQGRETDSYALTGGTTILAYSEMLGHFYLRADPGIAVDVLGVSGSGTLTLLGATADAALRGHGMAADDRGGFWVCDAQAGRVLYFSDPFPASN